MDLVDSTKKGYLLDDADKIPNATELIRELGPPAFHITRFFLHCSLYLACDCHDSSIREMMDKFWNSSISLKDFFWKHLNKDLKLIGIALNINPDEVILVIHSIMHYMLINKDGS